MTHEEIRKLVPGPDMDDLIEELVFSRTIKEFDEIYTNRWRFKRRDDEKYKGSWYPSLPYSSSIAAAWEVVEKMRENGGLDIGCYRDYFSAYVVRDDFEFRIDANTAPEAICRAALMAVMEG